MTTSNVLTPSLVSAVASLLVATAFTNRVADEDNANVSWYVGHVALNGKTEMFAVVNEKGELEALDAFSLSDDEHSAIESAVKAELAKRNA